MNKSDLIEKLYLNTEADLSYEDAATVVNTIIDEMTSALGDGGRVEIRGFGSFSLHHREARMGRNPMNGDAVQIPEKYVPHFKPGKALRERVNESFMKSS